MPYAIETDRLSRRFGDRIAVDAVSLQVPRGSVYGFLGCNGAGKTTTIRLLLGLLRPDSGTARIDGIDVVRDRLQAARRVGALLEAQGLYPQLSGRENLDLTRRLLGLAGSEIDRVLEITGMREQGAVRVGECSLGMRQRLGLARALLGAPPVLILDEPGNGLDPEGIAEMRVFLRSLPERSGATVLLSSHQLGEIEHTASHIGILSRGRLVLQGALAELRGRLDGEVLIGTRMPQRALAVAQQHGFAVHSGEDCLRLRVAAGESAEGISAALNRVLCVAGVDVHTLTPVRRSLEAMYREVAQPAATAEAQPAPIAA